MKAYLAARAKRATSSETKREAPSDEMPLPQNGRLTFLGRTTYRDQGRLFGIGDADRRHHLYVVGQTGTGKSTLLRSLMRQDAVNGRGFALIDPHGELAESVLASIPADRREHLVHFDLGNPTSSATFNPFRCDVPALRLVVAAGMLDVFKKLWADSWGARMEHYLRYAFLALVEVPGATLFDVLHILQDAKYRVGIATHITNDRVREFWLTEFARLPPPRLADAIAPVQNKVGAFLAHPAMQHVLGQPDGACDLSAAMNGGGIVIANVAKGRVGSDASAVFGALLLSTFARLGLERAAIPEAERQDFAIYLDEFQTFTTLAVAEMLAELRKYRLHLVLAHQYFAQLDAGVREAILGNVGSLLTFRLGPSDAQLFARLFDTHVDAGDIERLPNHQMFARLMVDGMTQRAFSAEALKL